MQRSIAFLSVTLSAALAIAADSQPSARRQPWTASKLQGTPEPPEPYRVSVAFPQLRFQKPTSIEEFPDADRLVVTEIGGKLFSFPRQASVSEPDLMLDLRDGLPGELKDKRLSLLDVEFHPQFAQNRYLYLSYVHPIGQIRVSRFVVDRGAVPRARRDSEQVIIHWTGVGHTGGCLEFGPDGYLYISVGDGAGPNPPDGLTTGQDVSDLLGSILRIDVDHPATNQAYAVPKDNPFVELQGARREIWAYGLRNPWKFGIDAQTGNVFAADNGWETWEMVHRIVRGGNCGWPIREGRALLRSEVKPGPTPITPPVQDHPHTEANSVIGGPVYRGSKLPQLNGSFIYGDYITGTIWAIAPDKDQSYSHTTLVDTDLRIVAFTQGRNGELFVLDHDLTGQIYELLPSEAKDLSASFPRRLSQTGLFMDLKNLTPAAGVVPYAVIAPRWVDGATAERWAAIPGDRQIQLSADITTAATYPDGTVFVKHLSLPTAVGNNPIRLETQLLHNDQGVWRPYSYLWNDGGTEATLVDSVGTSRTLRVPDQANPGQAVERTWHVNAVNECKLCHNAGPKYVLGFTAHQLDRPSLGESSAGAGQLSKLVRQGVLASAPVIAADDPSRLIDPYDAAQSIDDRARSYLHANCAMCHHPGGNAIVSFFLRRDLPFDKLNTNKGTGIGTFGLHDARLIVPGDPYRSVLLYRMSKLGYARMPYIGSRVVDSRGVALVEEWIRSLPASASTGAAADELEKNLQVVQLLQADRPTNDEAVRKLTQSTGAALAAAVQLHRGAASKHNAQVVIAAGTAAASDIRGLFETFIPESQRKQTLGGKIDPNTILGRDGDAGRGKLIFFSDGARCRNCHEHDDRDKSLGPTLQEIRKKYPRRAEMLQHVLQPSLKVDDPFAAYTVVTNDGRTLMGLVVAQNEREIVLKTVERQVHRIPRSAIDELQKSAKSLMPERVLSDLTAQEAADLFEYLQTPLAK